MSDYQPVLYAHQGLFHLSGDCVKALRYTNLEERLRLPWVPSPGTSWNLRCDPVLLGLYRQKGSAWISDTESGAEIRMALVPSFGQEYIQVRSTFAAEYTHEDVSVEFDAMYRDAAHLFLRKNKDAIPLPEDMARFHQHIGFIDEAADLWSKAAQEIARLEKEWTKERDAERIKEAVAHPMKPELSNDEGWQIVRGRGVVRRQVTEKIPVLPEAKNLFALLEE